VIQEIVNRPKWVNGNAINIFWKDDGSTGNNWRNVLHYDGSTTKAAKLDIYWTSPTNITLCTDSDDGKNYYVKGNVSYIGGAFYNDFCPYNNTLSESICLNGAPAWEQYLCPSGCKDGACILVKNETCTDSDGGKNIYVKGYGTGTNTPAGPVYDTCIDPKRVDELICQGTEIADTTLDCPDGYLCSDGACVNQTQTIRSSKYCLSIGGSCKSNTCTSYNNCDYIVDVVCDNDHCCKGSCTLPTNQTQMCTDSDGGKNIYVKGTLIFNTEEYTDYCKDLTTSTNPLYEGKILNEMYCTSNGYSSIEYVCPYGCLDGACILVKNETCDGCLDNEKCYPMSYRKSGMYCSDSGKFEYQLDDNNNCENNFECKSNVCIDGSCLSSSIIQKILDWIRNLF
ncbi:MAG: hypothetical protein V1815_00380, partial [Candidatus Woesearchaeota archaeon]